jgi:predicted RNA-binding protein with PIN domain
MRFARLPDRALATIQRTLEDDDAFRSRVADVASDIEGELGRPSWLWLTRPEGWEEELDGLRVAADASAASEREKHAERGAHRRLAAAEEARHRAEQAATTARAAATQAEDDLQSERQARRALEGQVASLDTELTSARARNRSAEEAAAALDEQLSAARQAEAVLRSERDLLRSRVAELEREAGVLRSQVVRAEEAALGGEAALARAVADASAAASALAAALASASAAIGGAPGATAENLASPAIGRVGSRPAVAGPGPAPPEGGRPPALVAVRSPTSREPRRVPRALPPAVFEDSAAAAEHLVRVPGIVLLVDGYNVTLRAWPELPIPEQRHRLVDALAELAARTGVAVQVVFDGAEQPAASGASSRPRSPVRLRFSPPDVEADEVLIELVDTLPVHQPVLVATSDRRVQDEVRRRGANVISTPQLLGLLGRAR